MSENKTYGMGSAKSKWILNESNSEEIELNLDKIYTNNFNIGQKLVIHIS
jgi:hypothetical protein